MDADGLRKQRNGGRHTEQGETLHRRRRRCCPAARRREGRKVVYVGVLASVEHSRMNVVGR